MSSELPFVSCLCPTFHRPKLLANALACYLAQDYPEARRELIILDDGNDFKGGFSVNGASWLISSTPDRFPSLPAKFNAIAAKADPESSIFMVWEDDDIYMSHHISAHVNALATAGAEFSKPSTVLSTYPGHVVQENAAGRFHASIAMTRALFHRVGGWPLTKRADFDQQCMSAMAQAAGPVGFADPCQFAPPSYCFRYGSTRAYHGQHFMRSPDDEEWYDRVPRQPGNRDLVLYPEFDAETKAVYASHSVAAPV